MAEFHAHAKQQHAESEITDPGSTDGRTRDAPGWTGYPGDARGASWAAHAAASLVTVPWLLRWTADEHQPGSHVGRWATHGRSHVGSAHGRTRDGARWPHVRPWAPGDATAVHAGTADGRSAAPSAHDGLHEPAPPWHPGTHGSRGTHGPGAESRARAQPAAHAPRHGPRWAHVGRISGLGAAAAAAAPEHAAQHAAAPNGDAPRALPSSSSAPEVRLRIGRLCESEPLTVDNLGIPAVTMNFTCELFFSTN